MADDPGRSYPLIANGARDVELTVADGAVTAVNGEASQGQSLDQEVRRKNIKAMPLS